MARMLTSASTSRAGKSVLEPAVGEPVVHLQDLGLTGRVLAPKDEEADLVVVEIDVTANQAIGPHLAELPCPPEQCHGAGAVASPQVNQPATRPFLQLERPAGGESSAVRSSLDPCRPMLAQRLDVAPGTSLQTFEVGVLEASPDAGLPPAVVALDHGLEAGFAWRHEHRHHTQAQAHTDDSSQGVRVAVRALEDHVVVELGI